MDDGFRLRQRGRLLFLLRPQRARGGGDAQVQGARDQLRRARLWSPAGRVVTVVAGEPGAPAAPSGSSDVGTNTVTWTAPSQTNGSAVTGYELQHNANSAGNWPEASWTGFRVAAPWARAP